MTANGRVGLLPASLLAVELSAVPETETDLLIVGAGIAGLTVADALGGGVAVRLIAKGPTGTGSTPLAQGGVAAAIGPTDSPELHFTDTITAGAGLCDPATVSILVEEAGDAVAFLQGAGVELDPGESGPALTIEGGHSKRRVVHAGGDATGRELVRALRLALEERSIPIEPEVFLVDLLGDGEGHVAGALVRSSRGLEIIRAGAVVLASGGSGHLYGATTSPAACTGDGTAAALRAGARLADLEFVQFHPTALHTTADPRPLISESLRGEGAVLRDASGEPVMAKVHPDGDLAPRDVVSRAMAKRMDELGTDHLYLDATNIEVDVHVRFPTITAACATIGIDPAKDWIPVSPTCHYTMGGIRTDADGRTSMAGLFAVGETAASGIHGANRLASNSLLEGIVFGRRIARTLSDAPPKAPSGALTYLGGHPRASRGVGASPSQALVSWLRTAMVTGAGVVRNGGALAELAQGIEERLAAAFDCGETEADLECANLYSIASSLVALARRREESRGAHFRDDFPTPADRWRIHQLISRDRDGSLVIAEEPLVGG